MFAIIQTGGKQYKVNEGDVIFVEKLGAEEGAEVATGVNFPGLTIGVSEAKGEKCPRCWMHSLDANAEGLCPRCAAVVAAMDIAE